MKPEAVKKTKKHHTEGYRDEHDECVERFFSQQFKSSKAIWNWHSSKKVWFGKRHPGGQ